MRGTLTGWVAVLAAMLVIALVLLGLGPARSAATPYPPQCGGDHVIGTTHHPRGQRPPLALGDSTMLLPAYDLAAAGYEVDAQGCREYGEALQIIARRRAAGTLPHMVLIALGSDGVITHADIGRALGLLCCNRLLVLVTNRELGGGSGSDAQTTREEAARHPRRILLLDWVRVSAGHGGDWFQPDGLHLTEQGASAFTRLLRRALRYAYPPAPPAWTTWREPRCVPGGVPGPPGADHWPPAARSLIPRGFLGIRLCRYGHHLDHTVILGPHAAGALAHDLDALPATAGATCPQPPNPVVVRVAYPHHRVVTVWVRTNGCPAASNGAVIRTLTPRVLRELQRLSGATPSPPR